MSVETDNSERKPSGCCDCFKRNADCQRKISDRDNEIICFLIVDTEGIGKRRLIEQMKNLAYCNNEKFLMCDYEWKKQCIESERKLQSPLVHPLILYTIGTLIQKAHEYQYVFDSEQNRIKADELLALIDDIDKIHYRNVEITAELGNNIINVFKDSAIQKAFDRRCDYLLPDFVVYFMQSREFTAMLTNAYIPTTKDVFMAKYYLEYHDYNFVIEGNRVIVTDSGKPGERLGQKIHDWLNRCKNIGSRKNFILFVASSAGYNVNISSNYTQMDILMNHRSLQDTGFILLLNESDVFHEKINEFNDFQHYFEEYIPSKYDKSADRGSASYRAMVEESIVRKFHDAILTTVKRDEALYCRFICATDREGFQAIISAILMDVLTEIKHCENKQRFLVNANNPCCII